MFNEGPGIPASNFPASIKSKMRKFINYLKESYQELTKKVTWPTWEKLQNSALLVLVTTLILAVVIFLIDFAFQHLMEFIYALELISKPYG